MGGPIIGLAVERDTDQRFYNFFVGGFPVVIAHAEINMRSFGDFGWFDYRQVGLGGTWIFRGRATGLTINPDIS